mmetsp:Transcript_30936/g.67844  ORF Transcript_30936/g.67844 Transcript_30936/m.67844 type:complete len:297 (+) Transcript_30936:816-1706(+)
MAYEFHVSKHATLGLLPLKLDLFRIESLPLLPAFETGWQGLELGLANIEQGGLQGRRFATIWRGELWERALQAEDKISIGFAVVWLGEGFLEEQGNEGFQLLGTPQGNVCNFLSDCGNVLGADLVQQALCQASELVVSAPWCVCQPVGILRRRQCCRLRHWCPPTVAASSISCTCGSGSEKLSINWLSISTKRSSLEVWQGCLYNQRLELRWNSDVDQRLIPEEILDDLLMREHWKFDLCAASPHCLRLNLVDWSLGCRSIGCRSIGCNSVLGIIRDSLQDIRDRLRGVGDHLIAL